MTSLLAGRSGAQPLFLPCECCRPVLVPSPTGGAPVCLRWALPVRPFSPGQVLPLRRANFLGLR